MKTTLEETLAEIYASALEKHSIPHRAYPEYRALGMRAVLDHLAPMEVPSVMECRDIYAQPGDLLQNLEAIRVPISTPWPQVKAEEKPADPYADLKAAAEAGKWMQCKKPGATHWNEPFPCERMMWHLAYDPACYRILTTITHDSKTYFEHRPGDEMPVGGDVLVVILMADGAINRHNAERFTWEKCDTMKCDEIIGYYPTALAEALGNEEKPQTPIDLISPQPEQDKPDLLAEKDAEIARLKDCLFQAQEAAKEQNLRAITAENKLKQIAFFVS